MKMGIVGLPNVGKSTLFNAITKAGAECANYPFCTIEPNVGVVAVPDERLTKLAEIYKPQKVTPAVIEFVDIAGLVKGASHGEGLGNKFLSHIREVDSIVEVVRCFEDSNIVHVDGSINPIRDIETINLELIFADIETVDKRIDNAKKKIKADKKYQEELDVFEKIKQALEAGKLAQTLSFTDEEKAIIKDAFLLTMKPILYVANVSEEQLNDIANDKNVNSVKEYAKEQGAEVISLCVKIEEELASLDEDEEKEMLEALGLEESGLDKVIKASYDLLGLMSFLTAGEPEVRAWTIKKGTKAPQAAGKIHSDIERGFIRAEIVSYDDLIEYFDNSFDTKHQELKSIISLLSGYITKYDFKELEQLYENANLESVFSYIKGTNNEFEYEWLKGNDPRLYITGYLTNCCFGISMPGEDILVQSVVNPCIKTMVIYYFGKMIGKTTCYYNKDEKYLIFNNIEMSNKFIYSLNVSSKERLNALKTIVLGIKEQVKDMEKRGLMVNDIRIGMNNNDLYDEVKECYKITNNMLLNYNYHNYEGDANSKNGQAIVVLR